MRGKSEEGKKLSALKRKRSAIDNAERVRREEGGERL